jgi:uncharacterized damage-inducible protein DinB
MLIIPSPTPSELSTYYQTYMPEYSGSDMLKDLIEQGKSANRLLLSVPAEKEIYRYGEDKWSVREVAGHVCDAERILTYRALRFSRKDKAELQGFKENEYTAASNYHVRPLQNIADEFMSIRNASITLFTNMDREMFELTGVANKNVASVKALLFFTIVHQIHHLNIIKKRYLGQDI